MRFEGSKKTPLAALSRAICGVREKSLVLNLPGSPRGAAESLEAVIDLLPARSGVADRKYEAFRLM